MARKARIKSSTGIYHVLVRAIADLSLFSDEEDVNIYTQILNDLQLQGRCQIYAYAYFQTHVHLLIKDSSLPIEGEPEGVREPIGSVMKRVASAYSYYFNVKYDHYGPIYIDRFKSNPVETKDYFLKVLNHIGSQQTDWKMTTNHIPSGLSFSSPRGGQEGAPLLDYMERSKRLTDSKLLDLLISQYHFTNPAEFLQRDEADLRNIIASCKRLGGSVRQLVRLTGTPFAKVATIR